jgi:hypothetical protein
MVDQEAEHVALSLATKAVIGLTTRIDVEGRGFLIVEGTETLPTVAGLLEIYVATDQAKDIGSVSYLLDRCFRDETQSLLHDPSLLIFRDPCV